MKLQVLIVSLVLLLWAASGSAFKGQPMNGPLPGPGGENRMGLPLNGESGGARLLFDSSFVLPPSLANPIAGDLDNAGSDVEAGLTVFIIPVTSSNYRLLYDTDSDVSDGTVVTDCYKGRVTIGATEDTDGTCDATAPDRVDFVLEDLAVDTKYWYRVERQTSGGVWDYSSTNYFTTLCGTAACTQSFGYLSDEHFNRRYQEAGCSSASGTIDAVTTSIARSLQSIANMASRASGQNYRFTYSSGDIAHTHALAMEFDDCSDQTINGTNYTVGGTCDVEDNCGARADNDDLGGKSCTTDNQCFWRWVQVLKHINPVIKYSPYVYALGNHDGETGYMVYDGDSGAGGGRDFSSVDYDHWYYSSTENLTYHSRNGRHKAIPNPDFTYGKQYVTSTDTDGAGNTEGTYYSFASGNMEFVISDAEGYVVDDLDGDGSIHGGCGTACSGVGTPTDNVIDDLPGNGDGWNDWILGDDQCTFLVGGNNGDGTCNFTGTDGRLRDTTWQTGHAAAHDDFTILWKFRGAHHTAGSTTLEADDKWYGRGGLGSQERFCEADNTTKCSVDADCSALTPATCEPDHGLHPMNGEESVVVDALKAFIAAAGGNSQALNLLGHDHLDLFGMLFEADGDTGISYLIGTQPIDRNWGPGWARDSFDMDSIADWGGTTNARDGKPDWCNADSVKFSALDEAETAGSSPCGDGTITDSGGVGSLLRGFSEVEVTGTTDVEVRKYLTMLPIDSTSISSPPTNNDVELTWTVPLSFGANTIPTVSNSNQCSLSANLPLTFSLSPDSADAEGDELIWLKPSGLPDCMQFKDGGLGDDDAEITVTATCPVADANYTFTLSDSQDSVTDTIAINVRTSTCI